MNQGLESGRNQETTTSFTSPPTDTTTNATTTAAPPYGSVVSDQTPYLALYETVGEAVPGPETAASVTINTKELAEFVRWKEAQMEQFRGRSNSGGSVRSIGIGAAGPISFAKYARSPEGLSNASGGTPTQQRTPSANRQSVAPQLQQLEQLQQLQQLQKLAQPQPQPQAQPQVQPQAQPQAQAQPQPQAQPQEQAGDVNVRF